MVSPSHMEWKAKHIWTFAAALNETVPSYRPQKNCPCININENGPYQVPSFVGDNYFCETANPGPGFENE